MGDDDKKLTSDTLQMLHGARSLEAVEALRPFLEVMRRRRSGDKLANASTATVTELVRSLRENHAHQITNGKRPLKPPELRAELRGRGKLSCSAANCGG